VSFPFFYVKRLLKQFWLFDLLIKPNAPFCWSNWPTVWKAALHFVFLNQVSSFSFLLLKHAYILEDSSWRPLQPQVPYTIDMKKLPLLILTCGLIFPLQVYKLFPQPFSI
jgi:hypothetical protein